MKRILFAITLAAAFVSCSREADWSAGKEYRIAGSTDTDWFEWTPASSVGIYSTDSKAVANEQCKMGEDGKFLTPAINPQEGRHEYLVYAPYNKSLIFSPSRRAILEFSIDHTTTIAGPGMPASLPSYTLAAGDITKNLEFTLEPTASEIEISIGSKEYEGYEISRIVLSDDSKKAAIAGKCDISIDDGEISRGAQFTSITATVSKPGVLLPDTQQKLYLNVFPGDYSATVFTLTITLTKGSTSVALPIHVQGVNCEKGGLGRIEVPDLKTSDNCIGPWYCPFEARQLCGEGYAYGDANCYFIQCKSQVYTGASLNPNPDIPDEVVIDYRLRGDYTKGEAPDDVSFEFVTAAGKTWTARTDSKFIADQYTFTADKANYTVTVRNNGSTAGAPILVMKKDGKILWGWTFWNIAADGTVMDPVDIGGVQFAPVDIGTPTTDIAKWKACCGDHISRTINYYQWGRYLPVFWNSYVSIEWKGSATGCTQAAGTGNVAGISGPFKTFAESLGHPAGAVIKIGDSASPNWYEDEVPNLWGGAPGEDGAAAVKSIYDPCPKGWRVPDVTSGTAVAKAMGTSPQYSETTGLLGAYASGNLFYGAGYFVYGNIATETTRPGGFAITNGLSDKPCHFWLNSLPGSTSSLANTFAFYYKIEGQTPGITTLSRTSAAPVRCQKDKDNR